MRWGIIGSGTIVTQFVNDTRQLNDTELAALYSRSAEKAARFAAQHGIGKAYASLQEMLADSTIENIYIGVPNNLHLDYVLQCVAAGKNVLCEKPMGINQTQVQTMLQAAKQNHVLLMEGMWTRFFPVMHTLRGWFADGTLGNLRAANISLGYNAIAAGETATWRFDLKSGFGALMDMGVYGVHFALDLCGGAAPTTIQGAAHIANGLDYYNSYLLNFGGKLISASSSIVNDTDLTAKIYTDKGEVEIGAPWWYPTDISLSLISGEKRTIRFPREADGLHYEVQVFEQCAQRGLTECPLSSHKNSLQAIAIMDELRKQWHVRYPQDDQA
ncbi:Gfo/Idh/MocA family oxidoreductase [Butyricicoccus faecihominis]|uniref:Gfo/Idh/MocA family protein n=1 Tax=Butyricicoccus faecihominis TaxID=1712515 RepID=UPI00247A7B7A|nr:Gfo/Idh/MocA family oxidoreductase [Butyricicoccus faecihominis]MCQ5130475.1 Gfo/Idh/MocA family oxidoreductase [Butyricicoccus faecihominis]